MSGGGGGNGAEEPQGQPGEEMWGGLNRFPGKPVGLAWCRGKEGLPEEAAGPSGEELKITAKSCQPLGDQSAPARWAAARSLLGQLG